MRTIIDLPDDQVQQLAAHCRIHDISRAEAIRQAVAILLAQQATEPDQAFGLWKERHIDALQYQQAIRDEWQA